MYTIKQASIRSGVTVPLLRQWERRYEVVRPARTDSGYRMYDEPAIARLRLMRELVEGGWAPSTAAGHVRGLSDREVSDAQREQSQLTAGSMPLTEDPDLTSAFIEAAGSLRTEAIESVLDEMFTRGSFEQVVTRYLMPALRSLGTAWADGAIAVAAEHVASAAVLRRLSVAYQAAAHGDADGPAILIGLPPGARHELGALAFAIVARRSGLHVIYLGADLPTADWLRSVEQTRAKAAVIGVVSSADVTPAVDVATALHAAAPDLVITYGGGGAGRVPNGAVGTRLADDLSAATAALRELIATRRADAGALRRPRAGS
jgi:DNA-binding transcriptional MerR regulator/methylmalonyl-CoA mutase cobalamin-binding subunit